MHHKKACPVYLQQTEETSIENESHPAVGIDE